MGRNFLSGIKGDAINMVLAAAAFNFKRAMRKVLGKTHFILVQLWKLFQLPKKSLLAA
jgi:IS5 family transposase